MRPMFRRQKTAIASERNGTADAAAIPDILQASSIDDEEIPRYPPFMRGLPAASVPRLMETQKELVDRLRQTLGLELHVFDEVVRPVLYRYVAFVHLLPASEAHHHRGAGGLLRHGLEVAFFAAQASEGVVFVPFGTPRERHELEPRWHVAVALAGLLHDLGKSVADVGVTDREGKSEWQPYLETLLEWARKQGVERYFLRWNERRHKQHEMYNKMVADRVLTAEMIQWVSTPQPEIVRTLFETISGASLESDMSRLVLEADQKSVEADLKANYLPASPSLGVPVEQHILDAMRCLMNNGAWTVNERGARVWVLRDGAYVVWKQAAEEMVAFLAKDRIPGIPRNPDTLADILIERGLAKPRPLGNGTSYRYWPVSPSPLRTTAEEGVILYMLKLSSPQILFSAEPPSVEALIGDDIDRRNPKSRFVAEQGGTPPRHVPGRADPGEIVAHSVAPAAGRADPAAPAKTRDSSLATAARGIAKPRDQAAATETATSWLVRHGAAGKVLLAMIRDVVQGKTRPGETLVFTDETVLIVYPGGVTRYGDPRGIMAALDTQGWIAVDPMAPLRKVREQCGGRGLVLTDEPARQARALLERPREERDREGREPLHRDEGQPQPARSIERSEPPPASAAPEPIQGQAGDVVAWPSGVDALVAALLAAIIDGNPAVGEILTTPEGRLRVSRYDIEAIARRAGVRISRLYERLQASPVCHLDVDYLFVRPGGTT